MSKVIELTQKELTDVIQKVIEEQMQAAQVSPVQGKPELHVTDTGKVAEGPMPEIMTLKKAVKGHLYHASLNLKKLMGMTGVNHETNGIIKDLDKVMDKYEHLFGTPVPKEGTTTDSDNDTE